MCKNIGEGPSLTESFHSVWWGKAWGLPSKLSDVGSLKVQRWNWDFWRKDGLGAAQEELQMAGKS